MDNLMARPRPAKPLILFSVLLLVLGFLSLGMMAVMIVLGVSRGMQEATEFRVPGEATISVGSPGEYTVWNKYHGRFQGQPIDGNRLLPGDLKIRITDASAGTVIGTQPAARGQFRSGDSRYDSVARFRIASPGDYSIAVSGSFGQGVFAVGPDMLGRAKAVTMRGLVFGGFGGLCFIAGSVCMILAVKRLMRQGRAGGQA